MTDDKTDPTFTLIDDGTLDTVLRCDRCGDEIRFTYQPNDFGDDDDAAGDGDAYDAFVESCFEDAAGDHECSPATDQE